MTPLNIHARRATVDDLPELRKLWAKCGLAVESLEPRLTEFQVAVTAEGALLGCIALRVDSLQGQAHSECHARPECESAVRERLWERIKSVAKNHGLTRLFVANGGVFWPSAGFAPVPESERQNIPAAFGAADQWLALTLREPNAAIVSFDREFELFRQAQQDLTSRAMRQARVLKMVAWVAAVIALLLCVGLVVFSFENLQRLLK